jgi:hypothetical protein
VVDVVERSVTRYFGVRVCFCNFRYLLAYATLARNTSEMLKQQRFIY